MVSWAASLVGVCSVRGEGSCKSVLQSQKDFLVVTWELIGITSVGGEGSHMSVV